MPSGTNAMTHKGNVVLYLDKELVEKLKEIGFNLSETFEKRNFSFFMDYNYDIRFIFER